MRFTAVAVVSKYVTKGWEAAQESGTAAEAAEVAQVLAFLEAVEKSKRSSDELEVAHLIEEHGLEREHVCAKHLKSPEVGERNTPKLCLL